MYKDLLFTHPGSSHLELNVSRIVKDNLIQRNLAFIKVSIRSSRSVYQRQYFYKFYSGSWPFYSTDFLSPGCWNGIRLQWWYSSKRTNPFYLLLPHLAILVNGLQNTNSVNRCICVSEFWHLKWSIRCILTPTAQKCTWKARFYKPCTSAASENSIGQTKLCALVYKRSIFSKCQGHLFIAHLVHGCLVVLGNRTHKFLSLDTHNVERGQLRCARNCSWNLLRFLTSSVRSLDIVRRFLSASDRNHTLTPIVMLLPLINNKPNYKAVGTKISQQRPLWRRFLLLNASIVLLLRR